MWVKNSIRVIPEMIAALSRTYFSSLQPDKFPISFLLRSGFSSYKDKMIFKYSCKLRDFLNLRRSFLFRISKISFTMNSSHNFSYFLSPYNAELSCFCGRRSRFGTVSCFLLQIVSHYSSFARTVTKTEICSSVLLNTDSHI